MAAAQQNTNPVLIQDNERLLPNQEIAVYSKCSRPSRSLFALPVELQLHILPFLDYQSLRSFSQTSKHFRSLFANPTSRDIIKESLLALEMDPQRRKALLADRVNYPCYRCLRILHAKERFSNLDTYKSTRHELGGDHAQRRRCMSCRYSYLTDSGQSELFVRGGQCWVACAGCRQVKIYVASNGIMKIAWTTSRRCVECAKRETDEDAQKRELWRDQLAKYYRWKQAAVGVQEPVKMTSTAAKLATEQQPKQVKKSSGPVRWLSFRRLFTPTR
jgi:F-box-like